MILIEPIRLKSQHHTGLINKILQNKSFTTATRQIQMREIKTEMDCYKTSFGCYEDTTSS
jgi:hypothetical protein